MALVWVLVAVALAIAEAFTATFVLLMLAAGALAAAGAAALDAGPVTQALTFAIVSTLALLGVRPLIRRHLRPDQPDLTRMGVEALEGSTGTVLERVHVDGGLVKLEGELWQARAYDATQVIEPGERVRVIEVKGATALVWKE